MANIQKHGVYDDFKPIFEWTEESENNILTIYPPNFTKEQIKITCKKSSRLLWVHGERELGDNKWSRFDESFPIPENCKIDKIHAKWRNGSLIVTMPKETITPPIAPTKATPQEPLPSKQGAAAAATTGIISSELKTNDKKSSGIIFSPEAPSSIHGEKRLDGLNALQKDEKETNPQKGTQETSNITSTKQQAHDKTTVVSKPDNLVGHREKSEAKKEIPAEELLKKKPENVMDTNTSTTLLKEGVVPKTRSEKKGKKEKKSKATGALKAVMEQTEERQLMINMGVAVLTIVALTAYVSYSFASKSKTSSS
ncbi:hypothetical protein ACOSP7_033099 [Xanthoceras sorbifolium]